MCLCGTAWGIPNGVPDPSWICVANRWTHPRARNTRAVGCPYPPLDRWTHRPSGMRTPPVAVAPGSDRVGTLGAVCLCLFVGCSSALSLKLGKFFFARTCRVPACAHAQCRPTAAAAPTARGTEKPFSNGLAHRVALWSGIRSHASCLSSVPKDLRRIRSCSYHNASRTVIQRPCRSSLVCACRPTSTKHCLLGVIARASTPSDQL